jgi:hypothetical protein
MYHCANANTIPTTEHTGTRISVANSDITAIVLYQNDDGEVRV